jgi:predicted transposase YdaD
MVERQDIINKYIILALMSQQIELTAEDALEDRDKLNEIVMDLTLERGKYTFADLIAAIRAEGFSDDTKAIFKIYLDLLGIKETY